MLDTQVSEAILAGKETEMNHSCCISCMDTVLDRKGREQSCYDKPGKPTGTKRQEFQGEKKGA